MNANNHILRVISLRSESSNDETFETILRNAGHKVTVLTSTEPAFALVNSSWPDVVMFDPISQFGMSGAVQRLRSGFDGVIVATGYIPDSTISAMLEELGINKFAATASELLSVLKNVRNRVNYHDDDSIGLVANEPDLPSIRQLELSDADAQTLARNEFLPGSQADEPKQFLAPKLQSDQPAPELDVPTQKRGFSLPFKRWHRTVVGVAVTTAVIIAVAIPFIGRIAEPVDDSITTAANTPAVVPNLMLQPLRPLTLEELSGEDLPLEIAGIQDRAVIEQTNVAFWGDTAPDAFVTVNGTPVDVSEYGAFIVDYTLEDGANYIEVLASDFQGRTTRQSFVVVSLQ